ncbi:tRNA lysidine(34) synthetase TilS [Fusobacterium ulcerans]|uniref:tRNA lysidine(34) synthetase TilS n=1 Tax=Fusobacterium ulcerans TaxID=861 RepID=UPI001D09B0A6|nr:tRNA lysidine(34) synthetase TilS [Fusobacterium ulcerans]MCB8564021.1 tRNA lysidine(34) synthetase TilS [Fusobacterium ulcerans]MCB8650610.1 tRNA lysidine(34) synthetase TilS [Fusobacterium ulcerans]
MNLYGEILRKNKKDNLVEKNDKIVVGFSGGPDSVFLVEMLMKLRENINFDMVLVHINHLLRGKNSDGDEKFSIEYGKKKGLQVFSRKINITALGKDMGLTLEEAGRKARYDLFKEVFEKIGANKIALAHNKDDQLETFMFRLTRGAGLEGLEGIVAKRDVYIRPISEIYKKDIVEYLNKNSIPYRIDETNFENEFTRNSIRLDLIPFIEKRYNPKFKDKLYSLIEEIREVNKVLEIRLEEYVVNNKLSIEKLKKLDKYLLSKVLIQYLYSYGIEVSRKKIQLIEDILDKGGSKDISLNGEFVLKKEYDFLAIEKNTKKENQCIKEVELEIPGQIIFGEYVIEASFTDKILYDNQNFYTSLKMGDKLKIRSRKDGDRIIPIGMTSEKKVKDILINEKVPKEKRDTIPLVLYNEEIVWIAGIKGNEKYKNSDYKSCVKLNIRRISS